MGSFIIGLMPPMVYLNSTAFTQILLTAIESYPLETTGLVFGFRDKDPETVDYEIMLAVTHHNVEGRADNEISENFQSIQRIQETQNHLMGYTLLGGFHSHPEDDAEFSDTDRSYLQSKLLDTIELVIGIEQLKAIDEEDLGWDIIDDDKLLTGIITIGDRAFEISIRGYRIFGEKIDPLDLRCAYVEMMEALNSHGFPNIHSIGQLYDYTRSIEKEVYPIYDWLSELEDSLEDEEDDIEEIVADMVAYMEETEENEDV